MIPAPRRSAAAYIDQCKKFTLTAQEANRALCQSYRASIFGPLGLARNLIISGQGDAS